MSTQGKDPQAEIADLRERLREAEEALAAIWGGEVDIGALVSLSPAGIVFTSPTGHLTYANERYCQIAGRSPKELKGWGWAQAIHPEDRERISSEWSEAASGGRPYDTFEYRFLHPDGKVIWTHANTAPIRGAAGELLGHTVVVMDITERKRAEEARAQLAAIVEHSDDAIIGKTLEGIITAWNSGAERLYGYPAAEALGRPVSILLPPDRADELPAIIEEIKRGQHVAHYETVRVKKDGGHLHVSLTVSPIMDAAGRVTGASTIARDITERKRAEEALRESEERYALAERAAGVGSWDWDILTGALRWSETIEPMFGFAPGRFGRTYEAFLECVHPDDRRFVIDSVNACIEKEKYYNIEHRVVWPDGTMRWMSETGDVIRDKAGRAVRMLGVVRDITERKQAEEALRTSEERFRTLAVLAPAGIVLTDARGQVTYANEACCRIVGRSAEEMMGWGWSLALHPEDRESITAEWAEAATSGRPYDTFEHRFLHPDGSMVWTHTITAPIRGEAGELLGHTVVVMDITERKRAEEALRASEERFRTVYENAPAGIGVFSLEGRFLAANQAYASIVGYTRDELLGKTFQDITVPEDLAADLENAARLLSGESESCLMEKRYLRKDGHPVWVLLNVSLLRDSHGQPFRFIAQALDITERKRAEEALAGHVRLMEAVFQGSHTQLVYLDRDFNFVQVNEAYARACAKAREDFAGHNHFELYPHPENEAIFRRVRDTGEPFEVKAKPFVFPDHPEWGETYWDWRLTPVKGAGGRVEGLVFSLGDVTERVRRLEELEQARRQIEALARREEERANWLAAILEQLPAGVFIMSADEKVVMASRTVTSEWLDGSMEGYGQRWRLLRPDGTPLASEERPSVKALREGKAASNVEMILVRPDGRQMPVGASALPLRDDAGRVISVLTVFWDLTEQKEAQRKLEEVSRLKDEFLSMASHELKTPVTSIKIFAELASRHPEVIQPEFLKRLLRQSDQLVQLINDLLDVSRLEMGRMPIELQPVDLNAVIREVCERPMMEQRVIVCLPEGDPVIVRADPVRLEQVFTNLLDNAAKYSPKGSDIRIGVGRREGHALVEVHDPGIGIAPEHLPHIFERFYKPGPQQAVYSGLGVGLYITREIVIRHGGRIWAESEEGVGSSFYVELPLAVA
jgi:PAS domain S-box-containing protein